MTLQELLVYFNESKTIGENKEAVDMMRHYSREAQKITMQINRCGLPERDIFTLDSKGELIGPKTIRDSLLHLKDGGIICSAGQLGGQWFLEDFDPIMELQRYLMLTVQYQIW